MFSVASMQGPGGSVPYLTFDSLESLKMRLRSIRVHEEHIYEMEDKLATGQAFSLPNVSLADEDLRGLGFYVLGNIPERFAAIAAVEGMKLDSEGAERLKRTERLKPEERRAETIHAFAQSRDRE
jgi:hypothetical protein